MGLVKLHFLQPDLQNLTNKSPADLNLLSFNSPKKLKQRQEQWLLMFAVCRKSIMRFLVLQVKAGISNAVVMNEFLDLHNLTKDHSPWWEELHPRDTVQKKLFRMTKLSTASGEMDCYLNIHHYYC